MLSHITLGNCGQARKWYCKEAARLDKIVIFIYTF